MKRGGGAGPAGPCAACIFRNADNQARFLGRAIRTLCKEHSVLLYHSWLHEGLAHYSLEGLVNPTPEQVAFRAELWRKFVAGYQSVLATSPESFSAYCEAFRARWIAGR